MKERELPEKYKTIDWLFNYGSIGLTKEHIKRLNNAINILESLNEHTDAKYLKEIKDKLLEDIPRVEKNKTDAFIEKACEWLEMKIVCYSKQEYEELKEQFKNYMQYGSSKTYTSK